MLVKGGPGRKSITVIFKLCVNDKPSTVMHDIDTFNTNLYSNICYDCYLTSHKCNSITLCNAELVCFLYLNIIWYRKSTILYITIHLCKVHYLSLGVSYHRNFTSPKKIFVLLLSLSGDIIGLDNNFTCLFEILNEYISQNHLGLYWSAIAIFVDRWKNVSSNQCDHVYRYS